MFMQLHWLWPPPLGSAQAQNLRDSGVKHITIGNRDDVRIMYFWFVMMDGAF